MLSFAVGLTPGRLIWRSGGRTGHKRPRRLILVVVATVYRFGAFSTVEIHQAATRALDIMLQLVETSWSFAPLVTISCTMEPGHGSVSRSEKRFRDHVPHDGAIALVEALVPNIERDVVNEHSDLTERPTVGGDWKSEVDVLQLFNVLRGQVGS